MKFVEVLQALNGATVFPLIFCLMLLTRYLCKEALRRGLRLFQWHQLPPSMNLALAMFVLVIGIIVRLGTTWLWYAAGENLVPFYSLFGISNALIATGALCLIRAWTEPDHGALPWIYAIGFTILLFLVLLLL